MKTIDVLNLEWNSFLSRDRQSSSLVSNYLRFQGYNVIEGSVFEGVYLILKLKPKMVYLSNSNGALINLDIVKFCNSISLPVIVAVSEGNFTDEKKIIPNFVWGVNKKQIIYETKILYWSERAKNLALSQFKDLEEKILVSGGIGFDYYKIKKASIKIKNKINIGIGCWDFGPYLDINDSRFESRNENYTEKVRNRFITDSYKFNQIFHEIVAKYKNIHFTFKEHPGNQIGENASAIQGLKKFENVTVINKEKSLVECISESDLWIVYESTTALEAWLLDKKTLLVNPSGTDFTRDITFKGSPNAKDVKELELILNKIILNLNFEEFDIKSNIRNKIIKDVIQYEDGLNHVRAGNFLIAELENNNQSSLITKKTNYSIMIKEIIKKILHKFKIRKIKELKNFDYKKINKLNKTILLEQKQFYKNNDLSKIDLFKYKCS